ncbi:hypothetical protein B0O80DRAFT_472896 [Mortierella sp. GBAus27b]|nr:hypothetical protein B0O80DRAFT_472896 [Mortierella sp. GBAus27b]
MVSIPQMKPPVQLRLIRQCPELRRLHWCTEALPVRMFVQSIVVGSWPMLDDICMDSSKLLDQHLSQIIGKMTRITGFSVSGTGFNIQPMSALRNHFHGLRRLDIAQLFKVDDRTCSEFTIEVLKSCSQLESLKARAIPADYLMDNAPWACETTLRILKVNFEIIPKPGGNGPQQMAIMRRLSKFVNLERLDMSDNWRWRPIQLSYGLKKLAAMTKLQEIILPVEGQLLSLDDVEWIIEHWRDLKSIRGVVGWKGDSKTLIAKFSEAGIGTCKLSVAWL